MNNYLHQEVMDRTGDRKVSYQNHIKKLIIYFFVIMLALTFVSRAADSVLVARVTLTTAKKGELTFYFRGSGRITANSKQYLHIYEGIHISKVFVSEGTKVEQGDPIFQYDTDDLKKRYREIENDIFKLQLIFEKSKLEYEQASAASEEAELALQRAKSAQYMAEQELEMSKGRIQTKMKEECETAKKEYEDALAAYEEKESQMNKEVRQANIQLKKAFEARDELNEERKACEAVLDQYRSAVEGLTENAEEIISGIGENYVNESQYNAGYLPIDVNDKFYSILNSLYGYSADGQNSSGQKDKQLKNNNDSSAGQEKADKISKAVDDIFRCYYGEENYKKHKKEVEAAEKNFDRVKEDFASSIVVAAENGRYLTTGEKLSYIRQYEEAITSLEELTKEDNELKAAIKAYGYALVKKDTAEINNTYATLFSLIYKEDKEKEKAIKAADEAVETAREALSDVTAEWKDVMAKAQKEVNDLRTVYEEKNKIYKQMLDGAYDYTEDVWTEEKQVESAALAVEDAEENVEKAAEADNRQAKLQKIDYKLYEMALDEKYAAANELKNIMEMDGKVTSPVSGYIAEIGVEEGNITGGTEKVAIAVDGCCIQIYVTKEKADRIEPGDELMVKVGKKNESIAVPVTCIGEMNDEGKVEITGIMPEGEYSIGTEVIYELTKKTKEYRMTIPITALHSDANGNYYVLVPEENNTVLGDELVARKIAVTVIDKSDTAAAVDGSLYSVSIISGSNKNIEEGDRVRCVEDE